MSAEEVLMPREMLPKAVKKLTSRVILYNVGVIFILTLNLSSTDFDEIPRGPKYLQRSTVCLIDGKSGIAKFCHGD